ncbi:MAG: dihydroorotase [Saprospiraceae bacterium]|nr:dihydroorotase [Saprospiraceae bacterium]
MELIIKQATILSSTSSFHKKKMDIHIKNGKIENIQKKLDIPPKAKVLEGKNLHCTIGLMDIGTHNGEPGFEHRETLASLCKAAKAGGYTKILPFPNTFPYIQTKSDLQYLIQKGKENGLQILPIGALSQDGKGVDIAEFYDMFSAGAIGFSDGLRACENSGLLMRALLYVKTFNGIIIHHPDDKTLREKGMVHEGFISTTLGLKGVPSIAELAHVQRDILLQEYTNSRMLIHAISSKEAADLLNKEKKKREKLFVSVPYLNLIATDKKIEDFNVDYKVRPVLREEEDRKSLVKALQNQTIDAVVSNHTPIDEDGKKVEFPYADYGAGGIETAFIATMEVLQDKIEMDVLVSAFNEGPRKIFNLPVPAIEVGQEAELCIFDTASKHTFLTSFSGSANNPFLGKTFSTQIKATILGNEMYLAS